MTKETRSRKHRDKNALLLWVVNWAQVVTTEIHLQKPVCRVTTGVCYELTVSGGETRVRAFTSQVVRVA